ncbi:MAG: hypothetical protein HY078_01305 [Elusimicrobia bacterium]|nr:hypothetical protein [Elusimicrobiota bacterium]
MAQESSGAQKETYWVRAGDRLTGPLPAREIAALPDVGPYTLLCPGSLDPKHRRSWRLAKTFPTVNALFSMPAMSPLQRIRRRAIEQPQRRAPMATNYSVEAASKTITPTAAIEDDSPPPELRIKPPPYVLHAFLLAAGVVGAVLFSFWQKPPPSAKERAKLVQAGPPRMWDPVLDFYLPACKITVREKVLGVEPIRQKLPSGEVVMEWPGGAGKEPLSFKYDPEEKNLTPMNASTKSMISLRKPKCP